jgi:hypothetical protein
MITKGTTFQPLFAIDGKEPAVGFLDGKIVYSKYVVFGTTYNSQDFTFPYAIQQNGVDVPHDWHVEVLSKAGTDPDNGDYYYCGLLNDKQDVQLNENPQKILEYFPSNGYQTTKIRDILWVIPFDNYAQNVVVIRGRNNTYLKSVDFSLVTPFWRGYNILNMFQACASLEQLVNLGPALEAFLSESDSFICNNAFQLSSAPITEIDFRGFTQWYKTSAQQGAFVNSCNNVERIYFSESSQDCANYVNASFNGLPKIVNLDFAKLRWNRFNSLSLLNDNSLETVTWPQGIRLKTGASLGFAFVNCYKLQSDPHIELWTGEDGISKPIIQSAVNQFIINRCGRDVSASDRTWYFDFSGWSVICNNNNISYLTVFLQSEGYKTKFDNFRILPYGTNTTVIIDLSGAFNNLTPDNCLTTSVDLDSAVDANITDRYISGLSQLLYYNTVVTSIKFGTFEAYQQDGEVSSSILSNVFRNSIVSSIDLLAKHINFYRQQTVVVQGQSAIQTNLNPLIVGDAVNWTNATQINNFIDSLVATQSKQFQMNNIKLQIQFNTAQRDIIQARPNWSTDIVTISNNGWELIFPVSVNGVWSDIDTSEMP